MAESPALGGDQVLRWTEGTPPGFEVAEEGRVLKLDQATWQASSERLQPGAGRSYCELGQRGDFGPWWRSAVGGRQPGIRRFRLQLPFEAWQRPWEGMIGALDPPRWGQVTRFQRF
jgi:hypothetical protein